MVMNSVVTTSQQAGCVTSVKPPVTLFMNVGPGAQLQELASQACMEAPEPEFSQGPLDANNDASILHDDVIFDKPGDGTTRDISDTLPAARQPEKRESSDQTMPNEDDPGINHTWEQVKSLAAAVFVVVCWVTVLGILWIRQKEFQEPVCPDIFLQDYLRSCETCGSGTHFLPLFGEWEKAWPSSCRIPLYLFGILWAFLGIGLVCDQFMSAIEEITSAERTVWLEVHKGSKQKFHVKCWNATIANLTLMALGSSAPEILLSIIEII